MATDIAHTWYYFGTIKFFLYSILLSVYKSVYDLLAAWTPPSSVSEWVSEIYYSAWVRFTTHLEETTKTTFVWKFIFWAFQTEFADVLS